MSSLQVSTSFRSSNSLFSLDLEPCEKHHQANEPMMSMRIIASMTQLPRLSDSRTIPNRYLVTRCWREFGRDGRARLHYPQPGAGTLTQRHGGLIGTPAQRVES